MTRCGLRRLVFEQLIYLLAMQTQYLLSTWIVAAMLMSVCLSLFVYLHNKVGFTARCILSFLCFSFLSRTTCVQWIDLCLSVLGIRVSCAGTVWLIMSLFDWCGTIIRWESMCPTGTSAGWDENAQVELCDDSFTCSDFIETRSRWYNYSGVAQ